MIYGIALTTHCMGRHWEVANMEAELFLKSILMEADLLHFIALQLIILVLKMDALQILA